MGDVVEFKQRPSTTESPTRWMFTLNMYAHSTGELDVSMEVEDGFSDYEIYEAMVAAAYKFAADNDVHELELELEDE